MGMLWKRWLASSYTVRVVRGQKTADEIAARYGVHPTQIAQWKKQALDGLPDLFSTRGSDRPQSNEENLRLMRLLDGMSSPRFTEH
jgi:transposase-like protein